MKKTLDKYDLTNEDMRTILRKEEEIKILVKMELGHHYKDSSLLELLEEQE